jgi:hypothetical protein
MQIESPTSRAVEGGVPDLPPGAQAAVLPSSGDDSVGAACIAPAGIVGHAFGSEEVIEAILGNMSKEVNSQAALDRASIAEYRRKCRDMRKKIQELMKKIREMEKENRGRGLLAKIFKWAAVALAAIAAVAASVFTAGGSMAAYGVAIGAAVAAGAVGCASGGCSIAAAVGQKKQLEAQADMMKAQMDKEVAQQIKEETLMHMEDLFELDARIGDQARAIMKRYDSLRQQTVNWR